MRRTQPVIDRAKRNAAFFAATAMPKKCRFFVAMQQNETE
jgi:hypothetical protein